MNTARKVTTQKELLKDLKVESSYASLRELSIRTDEKNKNVYLAVDGEEVLTTQRFWNSLSSKFQLSPGTFRYFTHAEVFERVASVKSGANIQLAIETYQGKQRALAVTSPSSPSFDLGGLAKITGKDSEITYNDGVATYFKEPKSKSQFDVSGDAFYNKFALEVPLDGYGKPRAFVSTLRQVCTNGMVAYAPSFTTDISTGKLPWAVLERAFNTFDNPDGYSAIRERLASAQTSFASVREVQALKGLLFKNQLTSLIEDLDLVTGSLTQLYGVTNLEVLSDKKRRLFKTNAMVYDLINFATEVATYYAPTPYAQLAMHAFVGTLLSQEYDLEGTAVNKPKRTFKDFLIAA